MEGAAGLYGSTLLTQTYTKPEKVVRCPHCGAELNKIVAALRKPPVGVDWPSYQAAYMHVQYECKKCKVLLKENYVNEFNHWNK